MSREEPGQVRPDHKTTAEFAVPAAQRPVDDTVTDGPADPAATVDDTAAEPSTVTDVPEVVPGLPEAPWTAQFGAEAEQAPPPPQAAAPVPPLPPLPQLPPEPAQQAPMNEGPPPFVPAPASNPTPPPPPPLPASYGESRSRRPVILGATLAVAAVIAVGAIAAVVWSSGDDSGKASGNTKVSPTATSPTDIPVTEPAGGDPNATPAPGTSPGTSPGPTGSPAPTEPGQSGPTYGAEPPRATQAPVGPIVRGNGITYQLVQQDPGYFEGRMVITNRTAKPMAAWKLTFDIPKANLKNIWGAHIVKGGDRVEIQNLPGAAPIQPGATWDLQYGAVGSAVAPKGCRLNGKPCGI
ncbi:cellulose binding domain-containing protein [Spirillospora sp. CA-294931]|uniref:cellulose binding domain-containing protein n=1 Tax=Spirillospora sp. CA-294931 TaxID=3240042 RepID=UPI003D947EC7